MRSFKPKRPCFTRGALSYYTTYEGYADFELRKLHVPTHVLFAQKYFYSIVPSGTSSTFTRASPLLINSNFWAPDIVTSATRPSNCIDLPIRSLIRTTIDFPLRIL